MLGYSDEEILKLAVENHNSHFDGVVQYNYETQKLFGCSMSQNETENPLNPFIEVFRLHQGEQGEINCKCSDCPYEKNGQFDDEMVDEFGCTRIQCCIDGTLENCDIREDIEEDVEFQIREVLSDHLSETISILNDIRIAISDIIAPYNYIEVRQSDYEMRCLDNYVDIAIDDGFTTTIKPNQYLDSEIEQLANICEDRDENTQFWNEIASLLREYKFSEVLEQLK